MPNPLTQVTDAFWTMLEANTSFTALVAAGNRVKYDNRDPEKDQAMYADFPWVRIRETPAQAHLYRTSNMSSFTKQYFIQVATGEQAYTSIHAVEWQIIRSLADWPDHLRALNWDVDGSRFVVECSLLTAEQMLDNKEVNMNIRGWSTVWACSVLFCFQTTALQP